MIDCSQNLEVVPSRAATLAATLPNDKTQYRWQRADITLPAEWYTEATITQWPDLESILQPSIFDGIASARTDLRRPN